MDPNLNMETGEVENGGSRSARFTHWAAFLVFSMVTLGSSVQVKNAALEPTAANKYAVACAAVTFVLTAGVVASHLSPITASIFVGTKVEGVLIIVLVAFWTAIVAVTTDAGNGLAFADDDSNQVQNANLYYFGWAGFVTSFLILVGYLRDAFGLDLREELNQRAGRLSWWGGLFASSLVVMGSAVNVQKNDCQLGRGHDGGDYYCRIVKLAISAGTLGAAFSLLVIASKLINYTSGNAITPFMLEMASSIFLFILSTINLGYTTSAKGPGGSIGNLYYFSWAMTLLSAFLVFKGYEAFTRPPADSNQNGSTAQGNGDIEVETFDDAI